MKIVVQKKKWILSWLYNTLLIIPKIHYLQVKFLLKNLLLFFKIKKIINRITKTKILTLIKKKLTMKLKA